MTKQQLLEKVENPNYVFKRLELVSDVRSLQVIQTKFEPIVLKHGDIFYHPYFKHYIVLVKKKKSMWTVLMITSGELLEATISVNSRFIKGFICNQLIQLHENTLKTMSFSGIYDNHKQLREVYKTLKIVL